MKRKLVVIGAGMASGRMLEQLIEGDKEAYDVTLFGAEPRGNYDRIMLSPVLSGEKSFEEIITHDYDWYAENLVTTRFDEPVKAIDPKAKTVKSEGGEFTYDKLVIATGSKPFIIPVPGHDLPGVLSYRDLDDVNAMIEVSKKPNAKAVVIGGGLLGLEAAAGLLAQGMEVTVIHLATHLMERQLDPAAGYLLQNDLEKRGIEIHCNAVTDAVLGKVKAEGIILKDGREFQADIVVMAVGIRPDTALAADAGLAVGRGIHVDDQMITSDPDIISIGECVEHDGSIFGLVAPLYDQAKVAAKTLLGEDAKFVQTDISTKLKVTGVDLFSVGDFAEGDDREEIVLRQTAQGIYKRLILKDNKIIGTVMYGDTNDGAWFFNLMKTGENISEMRDTLIFGPAYQGGATADPLAAVAALPDDAEICGCNGVSKSTIVNAINDGADSVGALQTCTKASASCGSCKNLVSQLLAHTLGDGFSAPLAEPVCGCTSMTHEDVRRMIKSQKLTSMQAVFQACEWTSSSGCHVCRPAVNYYLLADWPDDYKDDPQSRFVNERNHANIQKDGTYSVVPRMWGGITTSDELRAIADAAEKYDAKTVKVTGGQRIDLLGIKKEHLPGIWRDLNSAGMVSGHAYAKGLRTVKTCVGTDHCRFGTQDSTGLGIKLEKRLWGSWTPHKVKLAVSGCPRNCAEATCKDIGIICVDSGYEIGVGGAAGMDLKEVEPLAKVGTEEEALEMIVAFTQLYRENAKYLDRAYKWIDKVGLDWVKEELSTAERRAELVANFDHSQSIYQVDPWEERTEKAEAARFQPIADLNLEVAQ